jgi:hypothetical protein
LIAPEKFPNPLANWPAGFLFHLDKINSKFMNMNSMSVLFPYKFEGMWVFDDPDTGLHREPFVFGIDEIITRVVASIPNAESGFRLLYSTSPFPGFMVKLEWRREEYGGNWYYYPQMDKEGWLCPALFKYFDKAPAELYAKAEPKN